MLYSYFKRFFVCNNSIRIHKEYVLSLQLECFPYAVFLGRINGFQRVLWWEKVSNLVTFKLWGEKISCYDIHRCYFLLAKLLSVEWKKRQVKATRTSQNCSESPLFSHYVAVPDRPQQWSLIRNERRWSVSLRWSGVNYHWLPFLSWHMPTYPNLHLGFIINPIHLNNRFTNDPTLFFSVLNLQCFAVSHVPLLSISHYCTWSRYTHR